MLSPTPSPHLSMASESRQIRAHAHTVISSSCGDSVLLSDLPYDNLLFRVVNSLTLTFLPPWGSVIDLTLALALNLANSGLRPDSSHRVSTTISGPILRQYSKSKESK